MLYFNHRWLFVSTVLFRKSVWGTGRQKQRRAYRSGWRLHASTWSSVSFSAPCTQINHWQTLQLTDLWSLGKEPGVFDIVIINDDLERAYEELKEILDEVSKTAGYPRPYFSSCSFIWAMLGTSWAHNCWTALYLFFIQEIKKVQEAKS